MLDSDTAILDSDTLLSSAQIHSKRTLTLIQTLTQTNSIWYSNSAISELTSMLWHSNLNTAILEFGHTCYLLSDCTQKHSHSTHSESTWWSQPLIQFCHVGMSHCHLGCQPSCYLLSDSLRNISGFQSWLWIKLSQSDSNSFILT